MRAKSQRRCRRCGACSGGTVHRREVVYPDAEGAIEGHSSRRSGSCGRWLGDGKEVDDIDLQCRSKTLNIVKRHVSLLSLNRADISAMQLREIAKFLLGNALICPDGTEVPSQTATS